jgi:hypothetical protein
MFALSDEGALNFALTWPQLKGDPNWESISALSAPCARWPDSVIAVAFIALVNDIVTCKTKKLIKKPVASLLVDFIIATRAALGKHDWVEEMVTAAADLRLEARWGAEFDQSKVCEDQVPLVVSLLEKVFISSQPPWLRTLKDRAAAKLAETDPLFLQYGFISGYPRFRRTLADFLAPLYAKPVLLVPGPVLLDGMLRVLSLPCIPMAVCAPPIRAVPTFSTVAPPLGPAPVIDGGGG